MRLIWEMPILASANRMALKLGERYSEPAEAAQPAGSGSINDLMACAVATTISRLLSSPFFVVPRLPWARGCEFLLRL